MHMKRGLGPQDFVSINHLAMMESAVTKNKVHVVQSYHERWQLRPSSGLLCVTREDTPHILSKILTPRPETLRDHVDTHMVLLQNALPTHRCPGGRLSSHLAL